MGVATGIRKAPELSLGRVASYDWDRLGLLTAIFAGIVYGIGIAIGRIPAVFDFTFYWAATDFGNLYATDWLDPTYAYVYPPVLAQVLAPFHLLPYEVVATSWAVLCFVSVWYCLREWTLLGLGFGLVGLALTNDYLAIPLASAMLGNVQAPIAAAIVLGMRHPGWFAVPALTKLTSGVGLLWYAFRREWRRFAIGVGVVVSVALLSFVLSPGAWLEYVEFSVANYGGASGVPIVGPPLPIRVALAVVLVAWAARTDRAWLVPLACGIATPALYGWGTVFGVGLGAVALSRAGAPGSRWSVRSRRRTAPGPVGSASGR
jgi:hypothetical protein